jgi:hypothetical protein
MELKCLSRSYFWSREKGNRNTHPGYISGALFEPTISWSLRTSPFPKNSWILSNLKHNQLRTGHRNKLQDSIITIPEISIVLYARKPIEDSRQMPRNSSSNCDPKFYFPLSDRSTTCNKPSYDSMELVLKQPMTALDVTNIFPMQSPVDPNLGHVQKYGLVLGPLPRIFAEGLH